MAAAPSTSFCTHGPSRTLVTNQPSVTAGIPSSRCSSFASFMRVNLPLPLSGLRRFTLRADERVDATRRRSQADAPEPRRGAGQPGAALVPALFDAVLAARDAVLDLRRRLALRRQRAVGAVRATGSRGPVLAHARRDLLQRRAGRRRRRRAGGPAALVRGGLLARLVEDRPDRRLGRVVAHRLARDRSRRELQGPEVG